MTWFPDSCDCVLEYSSGGNKRGDFLRSTVKCKLHRSFSGLALHDEVISHNQSFNLIHGRFEATISVRDYLDDHSNTRDIVGRATRENRNYVVDYVTKINDVNNAKKTERERIRNLP